MTLISVLAWLDCHLPQGYPCDGLGLMTDPPPAAVYPSLRHKFSTRLEQENVSEVSVYEQKASSPAPEDRDVQVSHVEQAYVLF